MIVLIVVGTVLFRMNMEPSVSIASIKLHERLLSFNTCDSDDDCLMVFGAPGLNCYYFVASSRIDEAINLLRSSGAKPFNSCNTMNTASGIICSKNKCTFGEGTMKTPRSWH